MSRKTKKQKAVLGLLQVNHDLLESQWGILIDVMVKTHERDDLAGKFDRLHPVGGLWPQTRI